MPYRRHHSPEAMTDEEDAALKSNDCKTEIKLACAAIDFVSQRMRQKNRHLLVSEDFLGKTFFKSRDFKNIGIKCSSVKLNFYPRRPFGEDKTAFAFLKIDILILPF